MQKLTTVQHAAAQAHAVYNDINLKWLLWRIHRNIHLLLLGFVCFLPVALLLIE